MRIFARISCLLLSVSASGCNSDAKWESGNYQVYWIESSRDLTLGYDLGNGSFIGRVMPQVIAIGENPRWITAARRPTNDLTRTEYFYFSKKDDSPYKNASEIVQGPFTEAEFKKKSGELNLPPLTKSF